MSRMSRIRLLAIPVAGATAALLAVPGGPAQSSAHYLGTPSAQFWATHPESDTKIAFNGVYQANTDDVMLKTLKAAAALPLASAKAWKAAGPFGGVKDLPQYGSGAEQFGPIAGIGTAIAVDPADSTGNTVYFGTHGGLWKSTDGGSTLHNLSDASFLRDSVGAIGIDPRNHNNVYVGTGVSLLTLSDDAVGVGTYVSHDGGHTFVRPSQNTHGYGTNAITVSPTTGWVFVGTNYGLWYSRDHGASFHKIALPTGAVNPLGNWITAIIINPANAKEVTVAVGYPRGKAKLPDGTVLGPGNGLYRSMNNGAPGTFTKLASTSQLHWGTNNIGSSSDPVGRISLAYTSSTGKGMWALVSDAGRTAGQQLADLPALPAGSPTGNSLLNGLYYSTDDGAHWQIEATAQTLTNSLNTCTTCTFGYPENYGAGAQAFYNNWVLADPNHPNRVYIGLEETFQGDLLDTTGNVPLAVKWSAIEKYANACGFLLYPGTVPGQNAVSCPQAIPGFGGGSTHPDQHGYAITKTSGGGVRLYSGNDGGWWVQDAHAVTGETIPSFESTAWTSLNKESTVLPWNINFLPNNDIIMALQDNGTIHIKKDGSAYNVCGGDGVFAMPGVNNDTYYCGIPGLLVLGTTDDFKHTVVVSPGTPPLTGVGASFLSPFQTDRSDPNHLMAAAAGVWESTHGVSSNTMDPTQTALLSTTWVNTYTPPVIKDKADSSNGVVMDSSALSVTGQYGYVAFCDQCRPSLSIGPSINDPTHVHSEVATNVKTGCTAKMADSACWHVAKSIGLPHEQISGFAVDPNDARTIYVSLRQYILLGANPKVTGTQKVMVSHDAGDHFTDLTGNLPPADAHSIVYRDGQLYVATDVGVFSTAAGSKKWSRFGTGLPAVPYRTMTLNKDGRYLGAGAFGRGAYVYDFGAAAKTPPSQVPKLPGQGKRLSATGLDPAWPIVGAVLLVLAAYLVWMRRRVWVREST